MCFQLDVIIHHIYSTPQDTVCKNPPRSLTEEEYANIFQAVIDRCNSTSLEESKILSINLQRIGPLLL